jgi:hypothetical protein
MADLVAFVDTSDLLKDVKAVIEEMNVSGTIPIAMNSVQVPNLPFSISCHRTGFVGI